MRLRQAIDQFIEWKGISSQGSTVTGYANDLKVFCLVLKNREVENIQLDDVMRILADMLEAGWTKAAMMRKCMALRKFFEFLQMQGYDVLKKELIPLPRPEFKLPRVATAEQYRQLLAVIPRTNDPRHIRNRAIIMLFWDTGIRVGELCNLDIGDLNVNERRGILKTEKNRGSRTHRPIFWTEPTTSALQDWLQKRSRLTCHGQALFISCSSGKAGQRLTKKGVGEFLRQLSNRAGIPYVNPHSFRHHLGHHIIQQGGSNSDVAAILGHASLLSTIKYTQLTDPEVEERYRKMMS